MSQKLFSAAAQALYGPVYQSQLARELGISLSSCVRYDTGQRPVPEALLHKLYGLLVKRQAEIDKLLVRVRLQSVTWSRLVGPS